MAEPLIEDIQFLAHHGIKGMKWGVRRRSKRSYSPSADSSKALKVRARGSSRGVRTLSNQEIQTVINRMNLERNYNKVAGTRTQKGAIFVSDILTGTGKDIAKVKISKRIKVAAGA